MKKAKQADEDAKAAFKESHAENYAEIYATQFYPKLTESAKKQKSSVVVDLYMPKDNFGRLESQVQVSWFWEGFEEWCKKRRNLPTEAVYPTDSMCAMQAEWGIPESVQEKSVEEKKTADVASGTDS